MPPAPVNRDDLPAKWPTQEGAPVFWEEIGRTVAAFGFLEDVLARAYFALTATREYAIIDEAEAAFPGWRKNLERSLTDTLASLTAKIGEAFENDNRVLPAVRNAIVGRLCEHRIWRNALCHEAWVQFEANGSARLRHFRKAEAGPEMLDTCLSLEDIVNIRAETVDITILVTEHRDASRNPIPGHRVTLRLRAVMTGASTAGCPPWSVRLMLFSMQPRRDHAFGLGFRGRLRTVRSARSTR